MTQKRSPGWDALAISRIARNHYGSYENMFEAHGWPERGADMMRKAQANVASEYGSIENFTTHHED